MRLTRLFAATLLTIGLATPAFAEVGVFPTEVIIGQCAALSGPAKGLGTGMNLGMQAYIRKINAAGGINGRQLTLRTADDGYEPDRCVEGTLQLIDEDKVFALVGGVGTPTNKVAIPILTEKKVPLVGLFTGAMLFRQDETGKPYRYVINVRASYDDETEALVERLTKDKGLTRIGVFYQNDSFGLAGLSGTEKALKKRGLQLAGKGTFERNTTAIKKGLIDVAAGHPEAVIMVGPYKPIAAFAKEARTQKLNAQLCTISFVGTENFIQEAGAEGTGVVISQVVPSPSDASLPLVKEYLDALKAEDPKAPPSYTSFEGYVSAMVFGKALTACGPTPTREQLVDAIEHIQSLDIGGMTLNYGPADHQGSDQVFITVVRAGKAEAVEHLTR